eukprot:358334-Chlamydomonas_euryale.AAC.10
MSSVFIQEHEALKQHVCMLAVVSGFACLALIAEQHEALKQHVCTLTVVSGVACLLHVLKNMKRSNSALKRKAEDRNPDEFYFAMQKARTKDGVHKGALTVANKYSQEELRLMKTQDVKYLARQARVESEVCTHGGRPRPGGWGKGGKGDKQEGGKAG